LVYCVTEFNFELWNWKRERRFVVVREEVQTNKAAVGRKLLDCPAMSFGFLSPIATTPRWKSGAITTVEPLWSAALTNSKMNWRLTTFCLRSFFATESALLLCSWVQSPKRISTRS